MARRRPFRSIATVFAIVLLGAGGAVAQIEGGDRGVAPVDSGGAFEVGGIDVDVTAKTADTARLGGWRIAQRRGWELLSKRLGGKGGSLGDGALDGIVSGIVVENEQIGPTRYIARLGVLFDRGKASGILGVGGAGDTIAADADSADRMVGRNRYRVRTPHRMAKGVGALSYR